jgi:membrane protease subunit HflK
MARDEENLPAEERARRSVGRTLTNSLFALVVTAAVGGWIWFYGSYELYPGQASIILRLGKYDRTVSTEGLHFHLPQPIENYEIVKIAELRKEDFGIGGVREGATDLAAIREASMQTRDNAIVRLSFVVQYVLADAYKSRYTMADPNSILRDASQAAAREVVGKMTIEEVLSGRRDDVASETDRLLQQTLDSYGSGILVTEVLLQEVQPPQEVRKAFDDVVAAGQDASRAVNEAEGYRNELLPQARAEAAELIARSDAYRVATVAEASGEAQRFIAVEREYRRAPEVTRTRLYFETMEVVLPAVEKVVIEPSAGPVLPYLPLGAPAVAATRRERSSPPPPAVSAGEGGAR